MGDGRLATHLHEKSNTIFPSKFSEMRNIQLYNPTTHGPLTPRPFHALPGGFVESLMPIALSPPPQRMASQKQVDGNTAKMIVPAKTAGSTK
jgi:hypothetical protein